MKTLDLFFVSFVSDLVRNATLLGYNCVYCDLLDDGSQQYLEITSPDNIISSKVFSFIPERLSYSVTISHGMVCINVWPRLSY